MVNYSEYRGIFKCLTCKKDVTMARFYSETLDLTWLCSDGHMSKVNFNIKGY